MATHQQSTTGRLRDSKTPADDGSDGSDKVSRWAVAGFVLAFLCGPLGLLVSGYALRQTGRTGQRGQTLAAAGIGIGVIATIFTLVFIGSISFVTQINY